MSIHDWIRNRILQRVPIPNKSSPNALIELEDLRRTIDQLCQLLHNRFRVGYYRYGPMTSGRQLYCGQARNRIRYYKTTGNTEYLVDAIAFLLLEFKNPTHPQAHFHSVERKDLP